MGSVEVEGMVFVATMDELWGIDADVAVVGWAVVEELVVILQPQFDDSRMYILGCPPDM